MSSILTGSGDDEELDQAFRHARRRRRRQQREDSRSNAQHQTQPIPEIASPAPNTVEPEQLSAVRKHSGVPGSTSRGEPLSNSPTLPFKATAYDTTATARFSSDPEGAPRQAYHHPKREVIARTFQYSNLTGTRAARWIQELYATADSCFRGICLSVYYTYRLVPSWVLSVLWWTLRTLLVLLFILNMALYYLETVGMTLWCNFLPAVAPPGIPSHLLKSPPGCDAFFADNGPKKRQYIEDSLNDCVPLVPHPYDFLSRNLENVDVKLSNIKDLSTFGATSPSIDGFKRKYQQGAEEAKGLESEFIAQQQVLWESADRYIRKFPQVVSSPSRLHRYFGLGRGELSRAAREQNRLLLEVVDNALNRTEEFVDKLPDDRFMGVFGKIFNAASDKWSNEVKDHLAIMSGVNGHTTDVFISSEIWSTSAEFLALNLEERGKTLKKNRDWLKQQMVRLRDNQATLEAGREQLDMEDWEAKLKEMEDWTWKTAVEWRRRVKGYWHESAAKGSGK
ncbi:hypothetical protein FZEAL_10276 [Fusarium zealandicum]|uniref:Uncharacterized protein n=1 Tax=Fusarium zealandicum TaxID=1053134 RepID=A0A8H4U3E6_9HYPO|nr:hypothetical protein FZEAL_10276 [Fusarium zealandicum]